MVGVDLRQGRTLTQVTVNTSVPTTAAGAFHADRAPLAATSPLSTAKRGTSTTTSAKGLMTVHEQTTTYTVNRVGRLMEHAVGGSLDLFTGVSSVDAWHSTILARGIVDPRGLAAGAHIYVIDGGTLRRYTPSVSGMRMTGTARGYSTYRALTLLRSDKSGDVLLATTTRGALVTITAPAGRFVPRVTALRNSGWGHIDTLVTRSCGASTGLLAIDTRAGTIQSLTMGVPRTRGARTPITTHGNLGPRFTTDLAVPHAQENIT